MARRDSGNARRLLEGELELRVAYDSLIELSCLRVPKLLITLGHPLSCIRDDCAIGTLIPIHDFLTLRDDLFQIPSRRLRPNRSLQRNFPRFVQATT